MPPELEPIRRFPNLRWIDSTGSTNADLLADLRSGAADPSSGRVLIVEEQTAGRGRRDRRWEMPSGGGLLMSFYVPWSNPVSVSVVPMCLGNAGIDVFGDFGRACRLKWPNDVVSAGGRKLGGMLSELYHDSSGQLRGVVVGFGCNITWPPAGHDDLGEAVSLERLGAGPIDRPRLAQALIGAFDDELAELTRRGPSRILARYRERCATIGADVRVVGIDSEREGRAVDVDATGRLVLLVDGELETIDVGDVVHLRPLADDPEPPTES